MREYLSSMMMLLLGLGLFLFLAFVILVISSFYGGSITDVGSTGDAINGLTAPFIGVLAVLTTFLAFFVQYKANEEIRNQFKHERFETKFYELLKIHKENVSELEIDGRYHGRRVFIKMYKEFRFIYQCLEKIMTDKYEVDNLTFEKHKCWMTEVAYHHFFFGIGNDTLPITLNEQKMRWEEDLLSLLRGIKTDFISHRNKLTGENKSVREWPKMTEQSVKNELEMDFIPFGGHSSRLGHYYRHLYQMLKMVTTHVVLKKEKPQDEFEARYQYVKLIRVQLSNHEQTMVYYNSFFKAGRIWWKEKNEAYKNHKNEVLSYFLDYRIIKNLPFNLTNGLGPDPRDEFRSALRNERRRTESEIEDEMKELFEWIGG